MIAIENVRQFRAIRTANAELEARLEREAATREILEVISTSRDDETPVFDVIIENARRLCEANMAAFVLGEEGGGPQVVVASLGATEETLRLYREGDFPMDPEVSLAAQAIISRQTLHLHDMGNTDAYKRGHPNFVSLVDQQGIRTNLLVPLVAQGRGIGCLILFRTEVRPYSKDQIALVETFAAQAVIAIQNVRQFRELQTRLKREQATGEVLSVINRSRDDQHPVFRTILESASRLCDAPLAMFGVVDETRNRMVVDAYLGASPEYIDALNKDGLPLDDPRQAAIRAVTTAEPVQILDMREDDLYRAGVRSRTLSVDMEGIRTFLAVPIMAEDRGLGVIVVFRREVRAFEEDQISLLKSFAAQAAIAIENVRQFRAIQTANSELETRLEHEAATGEVLTVISQSREDEQAVFEKIVHQASRLCDAPLAAMMLGTSEDSHIRLAAHSGGDPVSVAMFRDDPPPMDPDLAYVAKVVLTGRTIHLPDLSESEVYKSGSRFVAVSVEGSGNRTSLFVPLLSGGRAIGVINLYRRVVQPFTDEQIALVQTFAEQAVIAIENSRQFSALVEARDAAEAALTDLKRAQERLVQSEKMASLGQLTAGIAHEIKNPLNFVNNFAKLSDELLAELGEILEDQIKSLDDEDREDAEDLFRTVRENLGKINQHGRRADSIIKNMLLHSREGPSERQRRALNPIVEEALNLAYHGARAENSSFNIDMQPDLAADAGDIDCYPQDLMRVFLNLISNGMYAAHKRSLTEDGFAPVISVTSRVNGDRIEVDVRDNGMGIPDDLREKIFTPFFTTKPAGEGTGLGLSLSYDIVVKQHGGDLTVDSKPGQFTVFRTSFPRTLPANIGGET